MTQTEKTVFISYRRTNSFMALAVYQNLTKHGFDVFFDYNSIDSGDFEQIIIGNIKSRAHFVLILTPSALERCDEPGDWLRREIETAIDTQRNIVPLMFEGFDYGSPAINKYLTGKLALLKNYNAQRVPPDFFDAAMEKIHKRFLNISLDMVIHPRSTPAEEAAKFAQSEADKETSISESSISAEELNEKGLQHYDALEYDQAIHFYTEAIRLNPNFAMAYNNRGLAHIKLKNYDQALADFNKAISLQPDFHNAYSNRAFVYRDLDQHDQALADFNKAISLQPDFYYAYNGRGSVYTKLGDYRQAIADQTEAIRISPSIHNAYSSRGLAYDRLGEIDQAIKDYQEAIRIKPDYYFAINNIGMIYYDKGDYKKAKSYFEKALEINPDFQIGISNLEATNKKLEEEGGKGFFGKLFS